MSITKKETIEIQVLYFAHLKEQKGCEAERCIIPERTTVAEMFQLQFQMEATGIQFAVNEVFVSGHHELEAGDVLAFLPPMGGG